MLLSGFSGDVSLAATRPGLLLRVVRSRATTGRRQVVRTRLLVASTIILDRELRHPKTLWDHETNVLVNARIDGRVIALILEVLNEHRANARRRVVERERVLVGVLRVHVDVTDPLVGHLEIEPGNPERTTDKLSLVDQVEAVKLLRLSPLDRQIRGGNHWCCSSRVVPVARPDAGRDTVPHGDSQ